MSTNTENNIVDNLVQEIKEFYQQQFNIDIEKTGSALSKNDYHDQLGVHIFNSESMLELINTQYYSIEQLVELGILQAMKNIETIRNIVTSNDPLKDIKQILKNLYYILHFNSNKQLNDDKLYYNELPRDKIHLNIISFIDTMEKINPKMIESIKNSINEQDFIRKCQSVMAKYKQDNLEHINLIYSNQFNDLRTLITSCLNITSLDCTNIDYDVVTVSYENVRLLINEIYRLLNSTLACITVVRGSNIPIERHIKYLYKSPFFLVIQPTLHALHYLCRYIVNNDCIDLANANLYLYTSQVTNAYCIIQDRQNTHKFDSGTKSSNYSLDLWVYEAVQQYKSKNSIIDKTVLKNYYFECTKYSFELGYLKACADLNANAGKYNVYIRKKDHREFFSETEAKNEIEINRDENMSEEEYQARLQVKFKEDYKTEPRYYETVEQFFNIACNETCKNYNKLKSLKNNTTFINLMDKIKDYVDDNVILINGKIMHFKK